MVKYRVPEQFKHGFKVISGLSDEQVEIFCREINAASNVHSSDSFINAVKDKVTIPYEDLRSLISTTFSLVGFVVDDQVSVEELAIDMADSYNAFDSDEKKSFIKNLTKIIYSSSKIKLIIKAKKLTNDYDKVFTEARILSDVRFVLGDDIKDRNQSGIIVHQLKIEYSQNRDLKHDFFAMDINDLQKLKISIERALEKDEAIRSMKYFENLNFLELSS